ncbi:UNVERIFIED_CONTAM: hypothetical protein GTU68_062474 [Idotea baltica]|nr:hypothetical protein [Idotea baltica]
MYDKDRLILITNDDSINSKGIRTLVEIGKQFGKVVVVAPNKPQSAMGHAITIAKPLRLEKVELFEGVESYQCSGTPVDCVKLAVDKVLDRKPDWCFSGINHGSNASINVIYSGTMSAAMEAAIEGIPAIGFSSLNYSAEADMSAVEKYGPIIIKEAMSAGMPKSKLLNANFPALPADEIQGVKLCRQSHSKWQEEFDEREDPFGRKYYWLTGKFVNLDNGNDTDQNALEQNFISIVPVQYDLTAYDGLEQLKNSWDI